LLFAKMNRSNSTISPVSRLGIASAHVHANVAYLAKLDLDPGEVMRPLGASHWADPLPEFIPAENYLAFLDNAAELTGDPLFGLHLGARIRIDDFIGYGMLLCACTTTRMAVEQTIRFETLCHDLGHTEVVVDGDVAYYRFISHVAGLRGERHYLEAAAAAIRTTGNWLARMSLPVFEFSFPHSCPDGVDPEAYRRVLNGPVRFDAEHVEARAPAALLDMPLPSAGDRSLFETLERGAVERLQRLAASSSGEFLGSVRRHIEANLAFGRANLETVAKALNLSPRTLNRRLTEAKTSFSELLAAARRDHARTLIANPEMTFTEVALLLGYNEQSSFNRAFRQWFDASPSEWRRKMLQTRPPQPSV
jgi:AraC-like DNA-binding protein